MRAFNSNLRKISSTSTTLTCAPRCDRAFQPDNIHNANSVYSQRRRSNARAVAPLQASTEDAASSSSNVEDRRAGRSTYRPSTFNELIGDAVKSILVGIEDGLTRMEVEFPAVSNVDGYKGASDLYIDSNIQLAFAAGKLIYSSTGKRVHLLLPDNAEYRRAYKLFKSTLELSEGVTMGHLKEGKETIWFSGLSAIFLGTDGPDPAVGSEAADMFIAMNASTIELPDLEAYSVEKAGSRPMVMWNMELDLLRADLGLLGFPSKDLQYRFLSGFKPVFYIRQRDYSKTVAVAPFIINYSGALFREYPGPWQVMLRQDNGVYACVAEDAGRRYGLGEFKAQLTKAMGLDTEAEGSTMAFLRAGYKTTTWWEDDIEKDSSSAWRT